MSGKRESSSATLPAKGSTFLARGARAGAGNADGSSSRASSCSATIALTVLRLIPSARAMARMAVPLRFSVTT